MPDADAPQHDNESGGATATAPPPAKKRKAKADPRKKPTTDRLPPWNVVLLDDDEHTYDYVIEMLGSVLGHAVERAFLMAQEVDETGRTIVWTGHRELAELKREQIISYGCDPRISKCRGGMSAILEPAVG